MAVNKKSDPDERKQEEGKAKAQTAEKQNQLPSRTSQDLLFRYNYLYSWVPQTLGTCELTVYVSLV
jgi:hypothetical protein